MLLISLVLIIFTMNGLAKDKIILVDSGWDSIRFHNSVARTIIEKGYGYPTEDIPASSASIVLGLKQGDIDIDMEWWISGAGEMYWEAIKEGSIIEASVNINDNAQGLYVPTYMIKGDSERGIEATAPDLKTIFDLKNYWELFKDEEDTSKGRIYGAPPVWVTDEILRTKLKTYDMYEYYNYFSPGSDSALSAVIAGAYEKGDPIVAYYWEPTWLMGMLDMTLLEDEPYSDEKWNNGKACEFKPTDCVIAINKDLPTKAPEVVDFLKNYHTNSAMVNAALSYMRENESDSRDAAIWFLKTREDVWTKWVPEEIVDKVKEAIK